MNRRQPAGDRLSTRRGGQGLAAALGGGRSLVASHQGLPLPRSSARRWWMLGEPERQAAMRHAPLAITGATGDDRNNAGMLRDQTVGGLRDQTVGGLRDQTVGGLRDQTESGLRGDELARLEAALFLARAPLTTRRLAKLARLADATRARALLRELRTLQEASGSAVRVEPVAGGFQLFTRAAFGPWVKRLLESPPGGRLSGTALETLAIVAYRQPVTRAEIEAIRGAGSEEMLRQLMERDLVAIGGRAEELGRPNVYVTTRQFLAFFGLSRLEDLPALEGLLPADESSTAEASPTPAPGEPDGA